MNNAMGFPESVKPNHGHSLVRRPLRIVAQPPTTVRGVLAPIDVCVCAFQLRASIIVSRATFTNPCPNDKSIEEVRPAVEEMLEEQPGVAKVRDFRIASTGSPVPSLCSIAYPRNSENIGC